MSKRNRRRHKPHDPAEAARIAWQNRADPSRWGPNAEALSGEQYRDVRITEPTRERTARILRYDCFETLAIDARGLAAVRRYQEDLAVRFSCEGSSRTAEHVDGAGAGELVSVRSLEAAERLDALAGLVERPWMMALIRRLCEPMVIQGQRVNWHGVVRVHLGIIDRDAQARAVKIAAEGLCRAWEEYDKRPMRRAA